AHPQLARGFPPLRDCLGVLHGIEDERIGRCIGRIHDTRPAIDEISRFDRYAITPPSVLSQLENRAFTGNLPTFSDTRDKIAVFPITHETLEHMPQHEVVSDLVCAT